MENTTAWRTFNPPGTCCFTCGGAPTVMVVEWPEGRIEGLPEGVRGRTYVCARDSGRIIAEQTRAGTTVTTRFVDEGNW